MSRYADNLAYWEKNEHKFPLQCKLSKSIIRPDHPDLALVDFLSVPISDEESLWGFASQADTRAFEAAVGFVPVYVSGVKP